MDQQNLEEQMMILRKKIIQLQLSKTLSHSMFQLLETIQSNSSIEIIQGEQVEVMHGNDLYEIFHITRPAMSKLIKECEKKNYVKKYISDKDKRYIKLSLTDEGKRVLLIAKNEINESMNWFFQQFDESELIEFVRMLHKINDVLDEFSKKEGSLNVKA
ncbi:MAG: MarR family winged helix-turn-helix transcriptional regulator [Traorella sp.]